VGEGTIGALVVIGGSTASGKSALAVALAREIGGVVVNADSQQLFRDLPTLTARPTPAEEAEVPHRLYGLLGPDEQASAGRWLGFVSPLVEAARSDTRPLLVTGGTGLYLEALLRGIAPVPEIPPDLRVRLRAEAEAQPAPELHARLARADATMAARLRPSDRQRVLRALEVVLGTERSLAAWQADAPSGWTCRRGSSASPGPAGGGRGARVEARLRAMLAGSAVEEVAALRERRPDLAGLPIAKVHGCREILAVLEGRLDPASAESLTAAQVRQYAKRQRTFFRHRLRRTLSRCRSRARRPRRWITCCDGSRGASE
jgi:tRNA dimethylallyltransferase